MRTTQSTAARLLYGLLVLAGAGLLMLTNLGILSLGRSFSRQVAEDFRPKTGILVIENVHVIPMDRERLLENQTVVIQDGLISAVGETGAIPVPSGALRIPGEGRYLMPGLTDMHVHVKEENELLLFAVNGVTSLRNMWGGEGALRLMGFPDHLQWKERIERGQLFGPTLYTSGPIMEGPPKTMPLMEVYDTPASAAKAVSQQVSQGYDFIKVYDYLDPDVYHAVIETARALEVDVAGHVPKKVGLDTALESGQHTIEHLSGFIDNDSGEYLISEDEIAVYALKAKEAGVWICPTIAVYQMHVPDEDLPVLENRPEMAYVSPVMKLTWQYFSRPGAMSNITYEGNYPERIREMFLTTTASLHAKGVPFILGTDSDNPYLIPGFSALDELDYFVEAGFSPYEALATGTRNAAEALGRLDTFGTLEAGKRADLILLEENPLEDIQNIRRQAGLVLRGQWYSSAQLDQMLADLAASYKPDLFDRLWPLGLIGTAVLGSVRRKQNRRNT